MSAEPVRAAEAVPGFRASIMDGWAIPEADAPAQGRRWRLVGRSAPGAPYAGPLGEGEAIRILTGAPLPEGARRVLPQELVSPEAPEAGGAGTIRLAGEAGPNPWIRSPDEETAAGAELLAAGVRLGPAALGRLASCGVAELVVTAQPRVGLLISGDELVAAGAAAGAGPDLGEQRHPAAGPAGAAGLRGGRAAGGGRRSGRPAPGPLGAGGRAAMWW